MAAGIEVQAARRERSLRERDILVRSAVDCLRATICIEGGQELLGDELDFEDRDFGDREFGDREFDGWQEHRGGG